MAGIGRRISEAEHARRDGISTKILDWVAKNPSLTQQQILDGVMGSLGIDSRDASRSILALLKNKSIIAVGKVPKQDGVKGMTPSLYSSNQQSPETPV